MTSYAEERAANVPADLVIRTRVKSKWRFVDLETGAIYKYGPNRAFQFTKLTDEEVHAMIQKIRPAGTQQVADELVARIRALTPVRTELEALCHKLGDPVCIEAARDVLESLEDLRRRASRLKELL